MKVICTKSLINRSTGEIHFLKGNSYNVVKDVIKIQGEKCIYYEVLKNDERWRYSDSELTNHFILLSEQRKLKIDKLNEI